jgi:PKD repeat protein
MNKYILFTLTLVLFMPNLKAQNWCGTKPLQKKSAENNPELKEEIEKKALLFNLLQNNQNDYRLESEENYIIPVVFHVIYENERDNISLEQIEDQMRIINEDFARLNPDTVNTPSVFAEYSGETNIQFRLAKLDPEGRCTEGVTRTSSHLTYKAQNKDKQLMQWPPQNYLNIWVVNNISAEVLGLEEGVVLGFAQFPNELLTNPDTDGIVLRNDQCGSIGTASIQGAGRTLTHEIGHWLYLRHIWGDEACGNDQVHDTPRAKDKNSGCPSFPWRVGGCDKSPGQEITQDKGEMYMNYMDYTTGSCQNMFSLGQGTRMRSSIKVYRGNLVSKENLVKTGTNDNYENVVCAPISEFYVSNHFGCTGDEIQYTNKSYNNKTDSTHILEWSFEGGTPSSSSEQNPAVVYNEYGVFKTTLKVSNPAGQGLITKEKLIYISDEGLGFPAPYIEDFDAANTPFDANIQPRWAIRATEDVTWVMDTTNGNRALKIKSKSFEKRGQKHSILTPNINLSDTQTPIAAYFDIAHAKRNGNSDDLLKVSVSDDCGKNWTTKWSKDTEELSTFGAGNVYVNYIPAPEDWKQFSINLNSFQGKSNVKLKFEFSGDEGNWLYLDNFVVCNSNELGLQSNPIYDLELYPNPSKGDATLEFELFEKAEIVLSLTNIYGAVLAQETRSFEAELNRISMDDLYGRLSPGAYFIQLNQNGMKYTKKFIITK